MQRVQKVFKLDPQVRKQQSGDGGAPEAGFGRSRDWMGGREARLEKKSEPDSGLDRCASELGTYKQEGAAADFWAWEGHDQYCALEDT